MEQTDLTSLLYNIISDVDNEMLCMVLSKDEVKKQFFLFLSKVV